MAAEADPSTARWPWAAPLRPTWSELVALGILVAVFLALALVAVQQASALGHDEAVYGVRAREMALGQPRATWFNDYRAPGLPWTLAALPVGIGAGRFRLAVTLLACVGVVATWLLGRTLASPLAGLVAAGGLALTPTWLVNSTLVLPDVPGASIGALAMAILALALTRRRLPPWAWLVVPLGMGATWMRFGAPLVLAIGLTTMVLAAWPRARPQLARICLLGATTAVGMALILLVPALTSGRTSPLAAIRAFGAGKPNVVSDTIADFFVQGPHGYGLTLRLVVAAATVAGMVALACTRPRDWPPGPLWAAAASVLTIAGLALALGHGEPRYLAPAMPLVWVTAGAALAWVGHRLPRVLVVVLAVAVLVPAARTAADRASVVHTRQDGSFDLLRDAALAIRDDPDLPCESLSSYAPQVEWYSTCDSSTFGQPVPDELSDRPYTLVIVQQGKRQPDDATVAELVEGSDRHVVLDEGGDRRLERIDLYGVAPRAAGNG